MQTETGKGKVAVTYSWNRIAYIVNKSLSDKGLKVYTGDTAFLHMNRLSLLGNRCFRYPDFYKSAGNFMGFLSGYLSSNKIPFLIPTHEEIFIISKYQSQLNGIRTLVPAFESLRTAHKKDLSSALADRLGITVPLTLAPLSEADCIGFFNDHEKPVVLKYHNSNSSKGVFYVSTQAQMEAHFGRLGQFILQEYVTGAGYGVSMLYNQGQLRASFTHKRLEEKLASGGTSTKRVGTRCEQLEVWARTILDELQWNGVAMVEFKYDEKKKKGWFIEINPRFWGSLALPYYSGMDFPYLYYRILKDGDVDAQFDYKPGVTVKWLLGGMLGFADGIVHERKIRMNHLSLKADHFDDFSVRDPFVLLGEMGYYLEKFLHSFQLNPTKNSSVNIDEI
jgi:predicted ATP-grasp superfamily ATP-dependent carboligase